MSRAMLQLGFLMLLGACNVASQRPVEYPIDGLGTGDSAVAGAWTVTLEVAQVGLGPIYFCATEAASADLCPTALAELADVVLVDAIASGSQRLGNVYGLSGELRSLSYDYGINWFSTQRTPTPAPLAPGGHSAHFEGQANNGNSTLRFVADVDIAPRYGGTQTVQGLRVSAQIDDSNVRLEVGFAPARWFTGVDFDALLALAPSGGAPVSIVAGSRAHDAIAGAMTNLSSAPTFQWIPTARSNRAYQ